MTQAQDDATRHATRTGEAVYMVRAYGPGFFVVNETRYACGLILAPDMLVENWKMGDLSEPDPAAFATVLELTPDIVLLGTGSTQRFAPPALFAQFASRRIALECMSTPAAVRTYNILAEEHRRVTALLTPLTGPDEQS